MVVVLGGEVWTLRERLAALEAIQVRQGSLAAGEVDAHDFSPEDEAHLAALRKEFIDSLFRVLQEQVEEAKARGAPRKPVTKPAQKPAQKPAKKKTVRRGTPAVRGRQTRR
jgi:hypothetical protein